MDERGGRKARKHNAYAHRLVTDQGTDTEPLSIYRASTASRCKTVPHMIISIRQITTFNAFEKTAFSTSRHNAQIIGDTA